MAATLSLNDPNPRGFISSYSKYLVNTVLSGNYSTNGEIIDFTTVPQIKASRVPAVVKVPSQFAGFLFEWVPGATIKNGKLKIYNPETGGGVGPGTELAAGAYPAGLTGASIILEVEFRKNL